MGQSRAIIGLPWKSVLVAAALVLGGAVMTAQMAFGRGMSGGAHFVGGGFAGHRLAISHGFVRPFRRTFAFGRFVRPFRRNFAFRRRNFATGVWWPYDYDNGPADAYGDVDTTTYPTTVGVVPEPEPAPVCQRSEEIVTVPAAGGGTSQIKIIRCP
jgi:hypothetical protein